MRHVSQRVLLGDEGDEEWGAVGVRKSGRGRRATLGTGAARWYFGRGHPRRLSLQFGAESVGACVRSLLLFRAPFLLANIRNLEVLLFMGFSQFKNLFLLFFKSS